MLFNDLFGLSRYPVWKAHLEFHYNVPTTGRILGERQTLTPKSLDSAWFDDVVVGKRDHTVLHSGNVHGATTQCLAKEKNRVSDVIEKTFLFPKEPFKEQEPFFLNEMVKKYFKGSSHNAKVLRTGDLYIIFKFIINAKSSSHYSLYGTGFLGN